MDIKKTLKKNKIKDKEFSEYAGFHRHSISIALKKGNLRQCVEDSLLIYLCKKKGIDIRALLKDMIVEKKEVI